MSPPTLSSQSIPIFGSITPTSDLISQRKRPSKPAHENPRSYWTAPFRDGLPTPPGDMTGVTYNAMPPVAYGLPAHSYTHACPSYDSISSSMVAAVKPTHSAPAKEILIPEPAPKKSTNNATNSPQIPASINKSKGSLAEFAAQMTCLFWFEKTSKLQEIEDNLQPVPSLVADAIPTVGFQKWVASILSTTQVSPNVILLALLFIYRLKKFNAGVKGKKGSEFRLMTVALMLGNKFLDDNTYTNKTWAEVSGIAVQEIHVMEVEFLSNIRYDLFASKEEWACWQTKLGLFADYFKQASMLPAESTTPALHVSPPRLQAQSPSSKLASPSSDALRPQSQPNWYMPVPGLPYPTSSQLSSEASLGGSRKRNRDDDDTDGQPTKRAVRSTATSNPGLNVPSAAINAIPTLPPVPTPTSAPVVPAQTLSSVSRLPPPTLPPPSNPMPHALTSTSIPQLPTPAPMRPVYKNWPRQMAAVPSVASLYNNTLPDLSRHHQGAYGPTSSTVSPAIPAYVPTPQDHLSPSFFLANRNSPYRPVRSCNTLLIPPPSTSMQQQRSVPFDHMHYQPLGKGTAERKTGPLPYIHPDAWNQASFPQPPFYPPHHNY
ncbi:hypothetical protein N7492_006902 [Penicillium capsulatum]|uniref:Mucin n=1 Tax=Penicillium capsulatum TaxID=69766 RepID=A0A9W9LKS8_9EURO|nr:hypothetical protein N7492_006902 [Penicillium capsulatum]KAJ6116736.1 hypothetical protein N7512_006461 [Penicillium capsulatum]